MPTEELHVLPNNATVLLTAITHIVPHAGPPQVVVYIGTSAVYIQGVFTTDGEAVAYVEELTKDVNAARAKYLGVGA